MALHVPKAPGFSQMLKDGAMHFSGLEEAVYRNIQACKEFAETVRTAYGPRGMNKIIINRIEKMFITNDAATIVKELEVQHPAARMMVLCSQMQEQEAGDGTSFVIVLAGALLDAAEHMLRMGLKPTEVIAGYEMALDQCLELLPSLVVSTLHLPADALAVITPSVMSKQYGLHNFLARLLADACLSVYDSEAAFNVDNVRVCKVLGGGVLSSQTVGGMVFRREAEGMVTQARDAKVVVFTCPVDIATTETKGTVLIKSAEELMNFSRGEEMQLEEQIKAIADCGVKVVVSGGKLGDMALHYINKYQLMAVRLASKFDVRRVCRLVGAVALPRLVRPSPAELGHCQRVYVDEMAATSVVVFSQQQQQGQNGTTAPPPPDSRVATVVVRGAANNIMDDIERAVDDGVNAFKMATKDGRMLAGGGACELELASRVSKWADQCAGVEQYAVKQFAAALETFPKLLADNSGANATAVLAQMYAAHQREDGATIGFNVDADDSADAELLVDVKGSGVLDLYLTKYWALRYAVQAACTVLRVDEIIMAKRSGGPKPPAAGNPNYDED